MLSRDGFRERTAAVAGLERGHSSRRSFFHIPGTRLILGSLQGLAENTLCHTSTRLPKASLSGPSKTIPPSNLCLLLYQNVLPPKE